MKYGVSRQALLLSAGIVWIIAGANILHTGITSWRSGSREGLCGAGEAAVVFLLFFVFVFRKLYLKHTKRIEAKKNDRNCPFSFFDLRGWIVMTAMIAIGISIRFFNLLPGSFISVFYTGLSLALIFTGALFIRYWWRRRRTLTDRTISL